jgi:hypothetical protein
MKTGTVLTIIGLTLTLGAPALVGAQTTQQQPQQKTRRAVLKGQNPITTRPAGKEGVRRSGLPPGFLDQNDGGLHFTDSTMRSVTRAGVLGVETGTFGSDVNGQIGTTNQNGMVHYPFGNNYGVIVTHFGSGDQSEPAPVKAHRSPRKKSAAKTADPDQH